MRPYGLRWSTGSVGDFESGRATAINLATLLAVAAALANVTGRPVTLAADLFVGKGRVRVSDNWDVDLAKLRAALSGRPSRSRPRRHHGGSDIGPAAGTVHYRVRGDFRETDEKNSGRASASIPTLAPLRWPSCRSGTFVAERDHRAGPGANAQRRGRISRRLKAELQEVIGDGND